MSLRTVRASISKIEGKDKEKDLKEVLELLLANFKSLNREYLICSIVAVAALAHLIFFESMNLEGSMDLIFFEVEKNKNSYTLAYLILAFFNFRISRIYRDRFNIDLLIRDITKRAYSNLGGENLATFIMPFTTSRSLMQQAFNNYSDQPYSLILAIINRLPFWLLKLTPLVYQIILLPKMITGEKFSFPRIAGVLSIYLLILIFSSSFKIIGDAYKKHKEKD